MRNLPEFSLSGDRIPCIGLGALGRSQKELLEILKDCPVSPLLLDTAVRYQNEDAVGAALRQSGLSRSGVFLTGKLAWAQLQEMTVRQAAEASLRRLDTDYFDLYLIHSPRCPNYPAVWRELLRLKEDGLARHIGVSGFSLPQMTELFEASGVWPEVNQIVPGSGWDDTAFAFCQERRIRVMMAAPFQIPGAAPCDAAMRQRILVDLYRREIVSVVGTRLRSHFLEDCSYLPSGMVEAQ